MESGEVMVYDEVIMRFHNEPMAAQVTRVTTRKLAIRWTLKDLVNSSNQYTSAFEYRATLNKSSNKISVHARPDGYPNKFSGSGVCTTRVEEVCRDLRNDMPPQNNLYWPSWHLLPQLVLDLACARP